MRLPEAIKNLADRLSELPSIGPRQAIRLAFHLVSQGVNEIQGLAEAVRGLGEVKICSRCFFVHQNANSLCDVCKNPARQRKVILVIERETDFISIENTGKYSGCYFIIGPISKTGVLEDWQKLRIQNLKNMIEKELGGKADEIILGFNPTSLGNFHASILSKELQPFAQRITRLGRGLPTGGEIEFADDETLGGALEHRGKV